MSAVTLPRRTSRLMSFSAWNEPYHALRSWIVSTVSSEAKLLLRSLPMLRAGGYDALGKVKLNVVPTPSSLCTSTSPPWACTMCFTIASPRPVPLSLRDLSIL